MSASESVGSESAEPLTRAWVLGLYEPVFKRLRALFEEAEPPEIFVQGGIGIGVRAFVDRLAEDVAPGGAGAVLLPDTTERRVIALREVLGRMEGPAAARPKAIFVHEIEALFRVPEAIALLARILALASAPALGGAPLPKTRIVATSALMPLQLLRDAMLEKLEDPYVSSLVQRFAVSEGGPSFFRLNPWSPGWRARLHDATGAIARACRLDDAGRAAWAEVVEAQTGGHPALVPVVFRAMAANLGRGDTPDPAAGPTLQDALRGAADRRVLAQWAIRWMSDGGLVPIDRAIRHLQQVEPEDYALLLAGAADPSGTIHLPDPDDDVIEWAKTVARLTATGLCFEDVDRPDGRLRLAGEAVRTYLHSVGRSEASARVPTDPSGGAPPPVGGLRPDALPSAVTLRLRDGGGEVTLRGVELRVWRALVQGGGGALPDAELIARAQLASGAALTSAIQRLRSELRGLGGAVVVERDRGLGFRLVGIEALAGG